MSNNGEDNSGGSSSDALREAVAVGVATTAGSIVGTAVTTGAIAVGGLLGALAAPVLIGVALYQIGKSGDSSDSNK